MMLKSSLCDYSNAYTLIIEPITMSRSGADSSTIKVINQVL